MDKSYSKQPPKLYPSVFTITVRELTAEPETQTRDAKLEIGGHKYRGQIVVLKDGPEIKVTFRGELDGTLREFPI